MAQLPFEPSPLAPRRTAEEQARDRDLGFGSVVSRESQQRLLLNELNHRVKNNMQMLQSLLNTAARHAKSGEAKNVLDEARAELRAELVDGAVRLVGHTWLVTAKNL